MVKFVVKLKNCWIGTKIGLVMIMTKRQKDKKTKRQKGNKAKRQKYKKYIKDKKDKEDKEVKKDKDKMGRLILEQCSSSPVLYLKYNNKFSQ